MFLLVLPKHFTLSSKDTNNAAASAAMVLQENELSLKDEDHWAQEKLVEHASFEHPSITVEIFDVLDASDILHAMKDMLN